MSSNSLVKKVHELSLIFVLVHDLNNKVLELPVYEV